MQPAHGRSTGEFWPVALFFVVATCVFTWPIAPRAFDGLADIWDAKLNAWILHWDFHQVLRDPLHLYDANIFFPARYALAFSENLFGAALFGFPLFAAGLSTLAVYNVVFLLGMLLSALAAWALARSVTGDALASVIAGIVYAFCPWRIAQIPHIQFQWGAFLALSLLFLLRYIDSGRRRDAVLFAICFAWNALCNVHYLFFSGFLIAVTLAYEGVVSGWRAFWPRLRGTVLAMAAAAVIVVPFLIPYALASKLYGMQRGYEEIDVFSGVWTDFLTAGGQNKLYAPLTQKWAKAEGELFPGIGAVLLAVIALSRRRRAERRPMLRQAAPGQRRAARVLDLFVLAAAAVWAAALWGTTSIGPLMIREPSRVAVVLTLLVLFRLACAFPRWSRFADLGDFFRRARFGPRPGLFLAIAVTGVVVALGTHTPYYRFLVRSFGPLFHAIRAPSRGVVLFDLGLAVLAAWGFADLVRGRRPALRLSAAAAAILVIGLEYRAFPVAVSPVASEPGPVYRWLATLPLTGAVMEWPIGGDAESEYEFRSTAHWKPINNGASGFAPPDYVAFSELVNRIPVPDQVWDRVKALGARLLVFHPHHAVGDARLAYVVAVRRGVSQGRLLPWRVFPHDGERDAVFWVGAPQSDPSLPPAERMESAARVERYLADLAAQASPPFGVVDSPREGETVHSADWGFGWALDDSGIAQVLVAVDGREPAPAAIGLAHPGVSDAYPAYAEAARSGFGFVLPRLAPGDHVLTVTIVAKDGGRTELKRAFRVR